MATLLFRGLPATGGVADYRTRQVLDGVIENLRQSNLTVASSGAVYSGTAPTTPTVYNSILTNLGGGAPVGVDFANNALRLRTLVGKSPITVAATGNTITVGITPQSNVVDTFKVKVLGPDPEDFLAMKLVNATAGQFDEGILTNDGNCIYAKRLSAGNGIILEGGLTTIGIYGGMKLCVESWNPALWPANADVPGFLSDKLQGDNTNFAGDSVTLLTISADDSSMWIRGLRPGVAIKVGWDPDVTNAGAPLDGDVVVDFKPDKLAAALFSFADHFVVGYDNSVQAKTAVVFKLKEPAGCDFAVGARAGVANTVARGDHTHDPEPSELPAGTAGDVLYYNNDQDGWIATNLATLVFAIIGSADDRDADTADRFLVKGATFGWAPLSECPA